MSTRTPTAVARPGRAAAVILLAALAMTSLVGRTQPAHGVDPGVEVVYVANGRDFADALVGAVLAAMNNTSVLTVAGTNNGNFVPDATKAELTRLKPKTLVVLGGPAAISDAVLTELGTYTDPPGATSRLFGDDRFATAAEISQALPDAIKRALFADDADLLDGMDSTAFAAAGHDHDTDYAALGHDHDADYAATGHDHDADYLAIGGTAADAQLLDGMDSSAFVQRDDPTMTRILLSPGDAILDGNANLDDGTTAGIELVDGGTDPEFGWTVELPPNYTAGAELTATIRYSGGASVCTFDMSFNTDSAWGPGGTARKDPTTNAPGSVDGTGGPDTVGEFTVSIGGDLDPGDLLWFGLLRDVSAPDDDCAGVLRIHGGTLTFG